MNAIWKSHNFAELADEAIDTVIGYAGRLASPQREIFLALLGGEANRVTPEATAYAHRNRKRFCDCMRSPNGWWPLRLATRIPRGTWLWCNSLE